MASIEEQRQAAMMAAANRPAPPEPRVLEFNITPELAAAMAKFQADLPKIERNRRVDVETKEGKDDYGYDYATLEHVTERVFPKLAALGLAFISTPTLGMDQKPVLRYFLTHSSGGYIAAEFPVRGEKMQQIGSAITYLRRYCLQAATGVAAPEDDDDGRAADATAVAPRVQRREAARQTQAAANTARRRQAPRSQGVTDDDPPPWDEDGQPVADEPRGFSPPADPGAPITQPQQQKIIMVFTELARRTPDGAEIPRDRRLQIMSGLAGRTLGSQKELTRGEAHEMIEMIESALATDQPLRVLFDIAQDIKARQNADAQADVVRDETEAAGE
jgi:hypothetical protein